MPKNFITIVAWCMYDWAASSFSVIVTTFIFATYFTTKIANNDIIGTYQWANSTSLAGIMIAFLSPIFGAIADHAGDHKRWIIFFTVICIVCSALLWFAYPAPNAALFTLAMMVLGTISYEIALVFYNAFLPSITSTQYLGRVSGWGWGAGYFGGILALTFALIFFINNKFDWLNENTAQQIRICGPFVAFWYFAFSLPFFYFMPYRQSEAKPLPKAIKLGMKELWSTIKKLPSEKNILLFLIAHMIYTDGLNTLFAFGGIYAAGTFGLTFQEVLLFGITMNITAGIGAAALGFLDDYLGSKPTILLSLILITIIGVPVLILNNKYWFWFSALLLCIFVGPIQSASRSLMVRLMINKKLTAEMFGLYAFSGKITAFIGPWILGIMTLTFNSQRIGMTSVLFFFILGALALLPVQAKR